MDFSLFREDSINKMLTPEEDNITDYVKKISIHTWIALLGIFILLISFLIWTFTSSVPNEIKVIGIGKNNELICYLPEKSCQSFTQNREVIINSEYEGNISNIFSIPLSKEEVENTYKFDYYKSKIKLDDWNIPITILCNDCSIEDNALYTITIKKESIDLIDLFFNNKN